MKIDDCIHNRLELASVCGDKDKCQLFTHCNCTMRFVKETLAQISTTKVISKLYMSITI